MALGRFAFSAVALLPLVACSTADGVSSSPGADGADGTGISEGANTTGLVASKDAFFDDDVLYFVRVQGWDPSKMGGPVLDDAQTTPGAELRVYKTKANSKWHCPDPEVTNADLVYSTKAFSLRRSGNFTRNAPKESIKIGLTDDKDRLFGMKSINLKSMVNDVSQMREAVAWKVLGSVGLASPDHGFAKLCVNDRYYGLYSIIENVDKPFVKDRFGKNDEGNLYKAEWLDVGPATLAARNGATKGADLFTERCDVDKRTYQLKTNDDGAGMVFPECQPKDRDGNRFRPEKLDDPALQSYDDLAAFVRAVNGVDVPGSGDAKFRSKAYADGLEAVFNVKAFLRWASVNTLLGAWDNYWGTPSNYYLYNSGKKGAAKDFMAKPYFTWIPWDYDNSLGIDRFATAWHEADLLDWEPSTRNYNGGRGTSDLPLVRNVFKNDAFVRYYLDAVEWNLDNVFNENVIGAFMGDSKTGLSSKLKYAAYLESHSGELAPDELVDLDPSKRAASERGRPPGDEVRSGPHTGRPFTYEQVYWNGFLHDRIAASNGSDILGILHFVRMRHDNARAQLRKLRVTYPKGSSGATFPVKLENPPSP
ncbi:MAG: CotH kinase family protein [Polyangiaceae bacterium]